MFTQIMNTSLMYFIWIYAAGRCIKMMNEITADGYQTMDKHRTHRQEHPGREQKDLMMTQQPNTLKYTAFVNHMTFKTYECLTGTIKYCFRTNNVS